MIEATLDNLTEGSSVESVVSLETTVEKRPQFGQRYLNNEEDVFTHNAWDNVQWDEEQERHAAEAVSNNSAHKITENERIRFQSEADRYWDSFYGTHQNRFFKDRHWLFTEFPELVPASSDDNRASQNGARRIFELGCGVGNTILPILKYSKEPQLKVYGCDFSSKAIEILRNHAEFDDRRCEVFVMDATLEEWPLPFEEGSIDVVVLIFVLSAIEPSKMQRVATNCYRLLRPGGLLLLRDYGRYDLAQLRFKTGKCLADNFYVRGDGTMVYFFTQEELRELFVGAGFVELQNVVDRRLQVNRVRMLRMYRVWIQTKFKKPENNT